MKVLLLLAAVLCLSHAFFNPISNEMVQAIKEKATTWTPYEPEENPLSKYDNFKLMNMFGSKQVDGTDRVFTTYEPSNDIPDSFSALESWPSCMLEIQDQQLCGADWALTAIEILSERFCIQTQGQQKLMLSVEDIIACDFDDWGCSGGYPDKAWDFMEGMGVVTEDCFPFTSRDGHREQCIYNSTCKSGADVVYKKYYATTSNFFNGEQNMQQEIMKNGPVHTEFQVYSDFLNYQSGIFQHVTGGKLGFYSAKVVGWGVENGTKYWIAGTTFGQSWGENGYFRILRGSNHCNFENNVISANPDLTRL